MEATLVKSNGEVSMDKSFDLMCSLLRNGTYTVKITRQTKPRSISQNALMWMWYQCMEEATGTPKEDYHEYYKAKFLTRVVNINGREVMVVGETKRLSTEQMTEFLNKVHADASIEGYRLPLPEDKHFSEFYQYYRHKI